MIRGTTPDYILSIDGHDLSNKTVFVTIRQGQIKITKSNQELSISTDSEGSTIAFVLSQKDTLALQEGNAEVQVRFIDSDGVALATEIAPVQVKRVLYERVIAHG